jgi:hypothetical protein
MEKEKHGRNSMLYKSKAIGTVGRMYTDAAPSKFMDSLVEMLLYEQSKLSNGEYIHYEKALVSWHELGRNQLVEKALGDWLLMLDTDHTFAPDLLERLLRVKEKYNAQVVSGIYQYKFPPHAPVMNMWRELPNASGTVTALTLPIVEYDRHAEAMMVGSVGAGCLLIDKKVFRRIENELHENPFAIYPGLSEDYSFCFRCKKLGIPIYVAPQIECHHLVTTVLSTLDYRPAQQMEAVTTEQGVIK